MVSDDQTPDDDPTLTDDVVASATVQESGGSYQITVPKDGARDLGIEKGKEVLVTGKEGTDRLTVRPTQCVFADD